MANIFSSIKIRILNANLNHLQKKTTNKVSTPIKSKTTTISTPNNLISGDTTNLNETFSR